jgi:hypothetical protein
MVEEVRYRSDYRRPRPVVGDASAADASGRNGHRRRDLPGGCRHRQARSVDQQTRPELQNEANYRSWAPMTSFRQIEANRRNARKSTGPTTEEGKQRSRCNAIRHGLTAETVIGALEDAEDYKAFEAAIIADYDAQSAVERELVLRLASLLWRLRRATTMETGLFEIQAEHLRGVKQAIHPASREVVYALFGRSVGSAVDPTAELARCSFASRQSAQLRTRSPQPV